MLTFTSIFVHLTKSNKKWSYKKISNLKEKRKINAKIANTKNNTLTDLLDPELIRTSVIVKPPFAYLVYCYRPPQSSTPVPSPSPLHSTLLPPRTRGNAARKRENEKHSFLKMEVRSFSEKKLHF